MNHWFNRVFDFFHLRFVVDRCARMVVDVVEDKDATTTTFLLWMYLSTHRIIGKTIHIDIHDLYIMQHLIK